MAKRFKAMGQPNYANGFRVTTHERALELPLSWKKPQIIFVNSMSDRFHKSVPVEFILRVRLPCNPRYPFGLIPGAKGEQPPR